MNPLLNELNRTAQSSTQARNSTQARSFTQARSSTFPYNDLSNVDLLINDIRRLEQIRPEINDLVTKLHNLYAEQVILTTRVSEALKTERRGSTQGITNILESNGRTVGGVSPGNRRRPQHNDNPLASLTSLISMFTEMPINPPLPLILTTEDLTQFPVIEYSDLDDKEGNCSICQETFTNEKGPYRKLPCNHLFHTDCIDRWLTTQNTRCPSCRAEVRT